MSSNKKGAMYPLQVLGTAVGWFFVFGVVKWAMKNRKNQMPR